MPYALREAIAAFRRSPLLVGLSAVMIALALYVVGLFGLAAYNLRLTLAQAEERVEVVAYLRDDAGRMEVALIEDELLALPEVQDVVYLSKEEALATARAELPEFGEVFTDLEVNPLPASLEIQIVSEARTTEIIERIAGQLRAYSIVEEVRYGAEWIEKLFALRRVAAISSLVIGGAFAIVAILIIGTAVRIAIFARREEIAIMRLVGATRGFIRRPFLIEGGITGLLGGLLAALLTWLTWKGVEGLAFGILWLPPAWVVGGVLAGLLLGLLASGFSLRRYLREV